MNAPLGAGFGVGVSPQAVSAVCGKGWTGARGLFHWRRTVDRAEVRGGIFIQSGEYLNK
jgi:hypothetical protein